jgi:hypothetical protein
MYSCWNIRQLGESSKTSNFWAINTAVPLEEHAFFDKESMTWHKGHWKRNGWAEDSIDTYRDIVVLSNAQSKVDAMLKTVRYDW